MNRQMAVAVLACLAGLWPAAAPAQYKINPPPIIKAQPAPIQIKPVEPIVKPQPPIPPAEPPTPAPFVPPPVVKLPPTPLPPAPTSGPAIEPRLPPVALPVNPAGGLIGDREREALDAARAAAIAERLANQESGLDAAMGAGAPGDDPLTGRYGIQRDAETVMEGFCKTRASNLFPGLCRGRYGNGLPANGDPSGFYDTRRPGPSSTDPGGPFSFDGQRAGSRVPSRDGRASDDETGPPTLTYKDEDGNQHDVWTRSFDNEDGISENFVEVVRRGNGDVVYVRDGYTAPDRSPGARSGDYRNVQHTTQVGGITVSTSRRCRGWCDPNSQPGESGYGQPGKARPWFCARNPTAKGCQPTAPGSQIDPAHPDGEGTPTGSRPTTRRLGSEAVVNPDEFHDNSGTRGGGSGPGFDMKDPVNPNDPEGPGRPPA